MQPARVATGAARSAKPCGRRRGSSICLTVLASSVYFASDSGGWLRERSCSQQTGNSGVNPGRPRRCDQATRSAASGHCGARDLSRSCEKACGRRSLEVRRPTRCHGFVRPRGRYGRHSAATHTQGVARSFFHFATHAPGFVTPCVNRPFRGRCAPGQHVCAWPPDTHPPADIEPACRWWSYLS